MQCVDNKAKERISKRVLQENKAQQIFGKSNNSYPLIRTRRCNIRFEIPPFVLLPTNFQSLVCFVKSFPGNFGKISKKSFFRM